MPPFGYNIQPFTDQSGFMFKIRHHEFLEHAEVA